MSFGILFFFLIEEDKRRNKAYRRREEKEHAKLTDKVGNEGLSRLLVEGKGYSAVGDEMIEKVVYKKYCRRY